MWPGPQWSGEPSEQRRLDEAARRLQISRALDEQLEVASIYFDRELESRIKKFTAMFEPIMPAAPTMVSFSFVTKSITYNV